jgi:hypothetical protein
LECPPPISTEPVCGNEHTPGSRILLDAIIGSGNSVPPSNGYAIFAQNLSQPGQAKITLETPAVALPVFDATHQANTVEFAFDIAADAACGSSYEIDYIGTADDNSFSSNPTAVYSATLDSCQPAVCTAQVIPIIPKSGNFFDPRRGGNGMTQVVTPVAGTDPIFFGAWFTGDASRDPTWYVVNDALHANQVNSILLQTRQSSQNPFAVTTSTVGTAQISMIAADKFVYTWVLNGTAGGAIYIPVLADPASSLRAWYNPSQSGWGTFDEFFPSAGSNGLPFMFNLAYIYDNAGTPRWTVGSDTGYRDGNALTEMVVRPACPACVWLDYTLGAQSAGTLTYSLNGSTEFISTNLNLPAPYAASWLRNALPLTQLAPQQ